MRAIVISEPGGPEVLVLRNVPSPVPQRGEARVRVRATAVNRADLLQRMGAYPAPADSPRDIPGLEFAGEVDSVGEGVTHVKVGDKVFGLAGGGAYAEEIVLPARTLARIPEGLSFVEAAAIPEAFLTAYDAMVTQAALSAGETVLVHAAGSGVGTAAVQIARAIGASCIGTARTADKLDRARPMGLLEGIVVQGGKFADQVNTLTGGRGADVILELVGGSYVAEDLACVAPRGRIVVVGLLAGNRVDFDLGLLMRKRAVVRGTVLRARPLEEKIEITHVLARHLAPLFATRRLEPVIDKVLPLAKAGEAHAYVASNDGFGKVVLEVE
ncbi:MAG TPA: NAD(P)H-quinone oxidoreductase [Polyangiaceae bacterium]|jgi:putative PIG3 family NAD(P)H quinone oxidoreductase